MKISYRVFWIPKAGLSTEEYEDAFAPEETFERNDLSEFRCAVSDGATETSFSGLWARILCKAYLEKDFDIKDLQKHWLEKVSGKDLPWYAEEKLESGAFATIVGLSIHEEKKGLSWSVRAIGDSCFFHISEGKLVKALPLEKWEEFDFTPVLLSTRQSANKGILGKLEYVMGSCKRGDIFYLMTDAIAKWFLHRQLQKEDAVALLEEIENEQQLKLFVEQARQEKDEQGRHMMHNDDVTWTRVCLVP